MIPQISKALASGYTSKQIIDYLKRKFPKHADQINGAVAAGFSVDQVLKFLSGGKKALGEATPQDIQAEGATEFQQTRNRDIARREEVNKRGLQAGTVLATSLAAPMAATALQRALPNSLKPMTAPLTTALQVQQQVQSPQQPPVNQVAPNIAQPPQAVQPEVKGINVSEILSKHDVNGDVDALIKSKNDPEAIVAFLKKFRPKVIKGIEKESGQPIENVVGQYVQEAIKNEAMQPEGSIPVTKEQMEPFEAEEKKAFPGETTHQVHKRLKIGYADAAKLVEERDKNSPKIEKSSTVSTPQGIGEVKEIRNGKALVEIDGKTHKVDESELEGSPIPEKDLAELHDDLLRGIESETGEDVSRMVQWAGYNPETNTLQFLPHTGKLYTYGNISPEDSALLRDILSVRKTSGANFIGAWKKDSKSPIGAALSKLIKKLQSERGGKGNEYESSYEPIYSAYEPAINAKKKKKK